ncbi:GDCCVxC domain-containing (seleno)protein [Sunxiuqinia indica]|uniref:GDCCVxC domain-containing (seleno)protein n=1 Tax=Sunxiuqinia indica TaxID=2692584 RepID=UPI00293BC7FB|nr:GDCCVxC domain-containing (seleno)protein [Sunxiuqinia indica]
MKNIRLKSVITCPVCHFQQEEIMPENACCFFYECTNCKTVIQPNKGDCCVYCSFGTVKCPSMQKGENCGT